MMTPKYKYQVAVWIPLESIEMANIAAQQISARRYIDENEEEVVIVREQDLNTFADKPGLRFRDQEDNVWLIAGPTPMRQDHVDMLPKLSGDLGVDARWVIAYEWQGEDLVKVVDIDEWAESEHGMGRSHSYRHTAGKGDIGTLIEERLAHMVGEEQ